MRLICGTIKTISRFYILGGINNGRIFATYNQIKSIVIR